MTSYKLFINGDFVDSISGRTFDSVNPFNQEVVATSAPRRRRRRTSCHSSREEGV
jgi:acyl-CoA reductase-like NAD-dependent aldehyde dehydrogenase